MELTQPVDWIRKPFIGYVMNAEFSSKNAHMLTELIRELDTEFGDAVFCMPKDALHITLLDWIAPLVDYDERNKDRLFAQIQPAYDRAISEILSSVAPVDIHFNEIKTSPSTVYIVGHDNGEFQRIRKQFTEKVDLLPGTKLPPTIIHSSLARFMEPMELSRANSFLANKTLNITQTVTDFRLVHTTVEPNLRFEILKHYKLK